MKLQMDSDLANIKAVESIRSFDDCQNNHKELYQRNLITVDEYALLRSLETIQLKIMLRDIKNRLKEHTNETTAKTSIDGPTKCIIAIFLLCVMVI